jgi:hypothetical protein
LVIEADSVPEITQQRSSWTFPFQMKRAMAMDSQTGSALAS